MKLTTASKITIVRVILIPVVVALMYLDFAGHMYWALLVFAVASVSDFVDGYIARHCDQVTNFGKFLDPLADKLLVISVMLVYVDTGLFPAWAAMIVIARELAVTGLRLVAVEGGKVIAATEDSAREYGKTETYYDTSCRLFRGLPAQGVSWMSHGDYMARVPEGFALTAHTDACPNVAIADEARGFYGVQYHPEVNHTAHGVDMIRNFLYEVCGAVGDWTMGDYLKTSVAAIREKAVSYTHLTLPTTSRV